MIDEKLERLRVLESLSAMRIQEKEPKFSSPGKFDRSAVDPSSSIENEKTKLTITKAKFEKALKEYRDLVCKRWAADKKNLETYIRIQDLRKSGPAVQEAVRALQKKNDLIVKEGEKMDSKRKGVGGAKIFRREKDFERESNEKT